MPMIDPGAARTLTDAGIAVIGHAFTRGRDGRERLAIRIETPAGPALVHDDPDGPDAVHIAMDDPADTRPDLDSWGTPEIPAALLELAVQAATALRARLADAKESVAAGVVDDLLIDLADASPDPTDV